ncbi:hypothetical protein PL263_09455 [Methylomonas sp. EFPC3]|uniref:GumC family protein n=1 Tax=Methylomonas sp. EFPC3 TaxID=3021710 RepID=UPI002415D8C8|nr:hypothetical protein [Methylomonas sp. EFPC3]WFP52232.1 hypothetical protein PL263_09455 [Methylomonas sp. EFPC3]
MLLNHNDFQVDADEFYSPEPAPKRLRRRHLFFLVLLPALAATESYVFLQPAVYQSQALVLTTAASDIDQTHAVADLEHVNIQKQVLLGQNVLDKTVTVLNSTENSPHVGINQLKSLFQVSPIADTNLVQLSAEGHEPHFLQKALNTWIRAYQQIRSEYIAEISDKATVDINAELMRLDRQVQDQRRSVETFRREHDIVSLQSPDNEAHARLQGLNGALNNAQEEEVKAKARLEAIRDALAAGKAVVTDTDSQTLAVLTAQAETLRAALERQRSQYTDEYIDFHPTLRTVKTQLAELERKIAEKEQSASRFAEQEAENNYNAAQAAVKNLRQELERHKQQAAAYTDRFAQHQAMLEQLAKLEELQRQTRQRLVEIEVKQRQSNPQLDVVDWASLPETPIRPDYTAEAAIAAAASLMLALLVVWLRDYLNREPMLATINSVTEYQIYHQADPQLTEHSAPPHVEFDQVKKLRRWDDPKPLPDDPSHS